MMMYIALIFLPGTILSEEEVYKRYYSLHSKNHGLVDWCLGVDHAVMGLEPEEYQEAAFAALRKEFIDGPPLLDEHFDFAEYLEPNLGRVLSDFVEASHFTSGSR